MNILALLPYTKTPIKGDNTGNLHTRDCLRNAFLTIRVIHQSVEMI